MAKKIIVDLEVKSNKGVKEVQNLNKEISKTNESVGAATNSIDKFSGGAVTKFKNFKGAVSSLTAGFKSLKVAIIGTGIGALLIGVLALKTAFTSSEEGQNKFAKILGVIGSVTGNLVDLLANLGEGIISVFENPKQALINFKNLIVENVTNRFNAIIDTLGFLGSAFKKVFSGDFKGALDDAKKAGSSYVDALTGIENSINKVTEATKGFVKELTNEAKIAGQIADQRAKADKLERGLIVERAEADRKVAELREKAADKDKVSAKDRIVALEEAGRISEEITNKEIAAAKLRFEAKAEENKLTKSTKEDLTEEANLKAKLIQLETDRLRKQKSITAEISGARKEEKARIKAEEDAERVAKEEQQKIDDEKDAVRKKQLQDKEIERLRVLKEQADEEIRIARAVVEQKKALQDANLNNIAGGFALLGQLAGKNKSLQAAAIIGESAIGIARTIIATSTSNAATIAQGAALAIPTAGASVAAAAKLVVANKIGAGLSIAANIAATAKGLSSLGGGGSVPAKPSLPSGGGGSAPSIEKAPPSFNVVGASETNQLADAIGGQTQKPVKAFVVSNDVSTAQEMDRNIVEGASL